MKTIGQKAGSKKLSAALDEWQHANITTLLKIAEELPSWKELSETQRQIRQDELHRVNPIKSAALFEALKAQVTYWKKRYSQETSLLNQAGIRKAADLQWLIRIAQSQSKDTKRKRIKRGRDEWDPSMISCHEDWLGDWQTRADVREALCYSSQQFWKLTREIPDSQRRPRGREEQYKFEAVLELLRIAFRNVAINRRKEIAEAIWKAVSHGSGPKLNKMRKLLLSMGAKCLPPERKPRQRGLA